MLVHSQETIGGVSVQSDAPALKDMALISREDMDGDIEAHTVCRTRRTAPINTAHRNPRGEVDDVDAGSFNGFNAEQKLWAG